MPPRSVSHRILIVDDADTDRVIATGLLVAKGFVVETATDAAQAMSAVVERAYDFVLVKAAMRCLGELAAAVRCADEARGRTMAVIAATAKATSDRALTAGADVFIERPLPALVFLSRVEAALASRLDRDIGGVWDMTTYRALESRLGRDRTLRQLESVAERFEDFRTLVADASASDEKVARFAHDVLAVGGMLGFDELAAACRRSQAAFYRENGPARCEGLASAIDRAISAASQARGK